MLAWLQENWAWFQPALLIGGGYLVGALLPLLPFLGLKGLGKQCGIGGVIVGAVVWGMNSILHRLSVVPAEHSGWVLGLIVVCLTVLGVTGLVVWARTRAPGASATAPLNSTPVPQTSGAGGPLQTGDGAMVNYNAPVTHGATPEQLAALLSEKDKQLAAQAKQAGVTEGMIIGLARHRPGSDATNVDQALRDLEYLVGLAINVQTGAARTGNEDALIAEVLRRVAAKTGAGDFAGALREIDGGLADVERRDTDERAARQRERETLHQEGIQVAILSNDIDAAAERMEALAGAREPGDRPAWTQAFRAEWDRYYEEGRDKGVNISLELAIALARRMLASARNADERGNAGNLLGNALFTLGERESGTSLLEDAVAAYRAALQERTRDRVPLDWATTQNNLGTALSTLGERESGTARLEEAVAAYRAALQEWKRDRVPLDWAMTQNNLGNALSALGARESGTSLLEEAVAAYRAALQERTRGRVPLEWATTQNNLGNALLRLGERESGTARLEEAVAAYRAALEERTRDRVPLNWATSYGNQGVALSLLGARTGDRAKAEAGLRQIVAAFETLRDGGHAVFAKYYEAQIPIGRAALAGIGEKGRP